MASRLILAALWIVCVVGYVAANCSTVSLVGYGQGCASGFDTTLSSGNQCYFDLACSQSDNAGSLLGNSLNTGICYAPYQGALCKTFSDCSGGRAGLGSMYCNIPAGSLTGSCQPNSQVGDGCSLINNNPCVDGSDCINNVCTGVAAGSACSNKPCAKGNYCAGSDNVCTAYAMLNGQCESSVQCQPGTYCVSGRCTLAYSQSSGSQCNALAVVGGTPAASPVCQPTLGCIGGMCVTPPFSCNATSQCAARTQTCQCGGGAGSDPVTGTCQFIESPFCNGLWVNYYSCLVSAGCSNAYPLAPTTCAWQNCKAEAISLRCCRNQAFGTVWVPGGVQCDLSSGVIEVPLNTAILVGTIGFLLAMLAAITAGVFYYKWQELVPQLSKFQQLEQEMKGLGTKFLGS